MLDVAAMPPISQGSVSTDVESLISVLIRLNKFTQLLSRIIDVKCRRRGVSLATHSELDGVYSCLDDYFISLTDLDPQWTTKRS